MCRKGREGTNGTGGNPYAARQVRTPSATRAQSGSAKEGERERKGGDKNVTLGVCVISLAAVHRDNKVSVGAALHGCEMGLWRSVPLSPACD